MVAPVASRSNVEGIGHQQEGGRRGGSRAGRSTAAPLQAGPQAAASGDVDAMLLAEAGHHPHPAPDDSEPAPKRPHVVGGATNDVAATHSGVFVVGSTTRTAKDQGHNRHRNTPPGGGNRVVGAAAAIAGAAKDQGGTATRGTSPPSTVGTPAPAPEVAALTAGVFARLAAPGANPPGPAPRLPAAAEHAIDSPPAPSAATTELEAAAAAAVAAGGAATAPAVASAAARRSRSIGRGPLPPITPCPSLADPASAQGQLADALISAAVRCTSPALPSPPDGGSPEPQGSGGNGTVASTPPRQPPPSASGPTRMGSGGRSVGQALGTTGLELRQPEGSGLREPPSTPATKSGVSLGGGNEGLPFARSLPETPPTTPMWPSTANNNSIQHWGSGRLAREGSASGAASAGAGSGAETPAATAAGGAAAATRGAGSSSAAAPLGVDSEQLRTAMQGLAVDDNRNNNCWDEDRGDAGGRMEAGQQGTAAFATVPPSNAAAEGVSSRPANSVPTANGFATVVPGGGAALPQPAPLPRGPVTPSVSRRLPAEIPAIPEDTAVTAPPLPPTSTPGGVAPQTGGTTGSIAEEGDDSVHGTGDADSTTGMPLPALPFVRVSSTHSAASAALEDALLHSVPLDEMALLRSASRGGTPRAGSYSYASSTASSQDRPDLAELAVFGHGIVCVGGSNSFRSGGGHHRLASSSGRSRSRSPSPSPFTGDAVQRTVRAQLGPRSWSGSGVAAAVAAADSSMHAASDIGRVDAAGAASAVAAAADAASALSAVSPNGLPPPLSALMTVETVDGGRPAAPLLPAASTPLAPNRCVTELPAAERAQLWDSDAPVAPHQAALARGSSHAHATKPGMRPPSSLLHRGGSRRGSDSPWWGAWGCGCFGAPQRCDSNSATNN